MSALFKFVNSFTGVRNLFGNRNNLVVYQQQAFIKQATKDKLKELNLPEKPKKPLTPYFRYMRDHREEIVRNNPSFKLPDVARKCAADWALVHATIKEKYVAEYKADVETYNKEFLQYSNKLTEEQKDALKLASKEKLAEKKRREMKKRFKETDRPKRPLGPYMQYLLEISRKQNLTMPQVIQNQKGKWQALPEAEKQIYVTRYEEDKKRYDKDMEQWEARMLEEGNTDVIRNSSKKEKRPSRLGKSKIAIEE